ncbi:tail assembly chaperone [Rummeliibacillus sp. NPDC094406]|uniref:tail assembly chaperone n=1 Tax=Rummeliibacillus sp. NPDC094406 TaxID=3364511 RepID=UPI00380378D8
MSLLLKIGDKEVQGKPSFAFLKLADAKYGTFQEKTGEMTGGLMNILSGVIEGDVQSAAKYWDCATAHLKEKPTIEKIEEALESRIEVDEDTEPLLKEIYSELTNSGFFKKTVKEFWKNLEMMKDFGKTEEEKADNKKAYDLMMEKKVEIEA